MPGPSNALTNVQVSALAAIEGGNEGPFLPYNLAAVHAIRGDREAAFRWVDRAVALGKKEELFLARDPLLENLHDDPRFAEILARNKAEIERQRTRVEREGW